MMLLILGLLLFFATHSVRIVAEGWRAARIARMGEPAWKGVYSLLSLLGLALMVWGYRETRGAVELWQPPIWTRHMAGLLTLPSFVLLVAAYVPRTRIKAALGHPIEETHGAPEARGATIAGTQVHSLRLPSFTVSAEIVFAAEDERLSIRHDAGSSAETLALKLAQLNRTTTVSFASEAGQFQKAEISSVVCGPGSIDQAHQPDEFIEISQVEAGIGFMRRLAAELS